MSAARGAEGERRGGSALISLPPACVRPSRSAPPGRLRSRSRHGFEQAKRPCQILVRHLTEDGVANVLGYPLDLLDRPAPRDVSTRVLARRSAGSSPRSIRPEVSSASSRRTTEDPIERQRGGQLILPHGRLRSRDPKQRQPCRFGQAVSLQTPIDRAPPFARHMGDERSESIQGVFCGQSASAP